MTSTVWRCDSPRSSSRWWMCAAVRAERRAALRDAPDDDPERVDDRHAEDEQRDRDLGRAEDREHAPACSPTNWTPLVPAKIEAGWKFQRRNPSSDPGEDEAQDRDERLADAASSG